MRPNDSGSKFVETFTTSAKISQKGDTMGKIKQEKMPAPGEKPDYVKHVLEYAKPILNDLAGQFANKICAEQFEEIRQDAFLRLWRKYPRIEADKGWRSLVYNHCRGAVLDYLKHGKGFQEERWSIQKPEEVGDVHVGKLQSRVPLTSSDGEDICIDQIVGQNGIFDELNVDRIEIDWDLVAKLASQDECLHAFAKNLRGVTLEKIAPVFGIEIARAGQLVQAFIERFDDPEHADCPWFKQTCFALGICEVLGMPNVDQTKILGFSVGHGLAPVDLDTTQPMKYVLERDAQQSFFQDEMVGTVQKGGRRRSIVNAEGIRFYISSFEPAEVDKIPLGSKVRFVGFHPTETRGIAEKIELIGTHGQK